ncbi:hypothetical protein FB446DRAFT_175648 [Lentinula raphanica]|nr:hypothetical protein FB446DRAFT_175648 [Lentinula raphanica]
MRCIAFLLLELLACGTTYAIPAPPPVVYGGAPDNRLTPSNLGVGVKWEYWRLPRETESDRKIRNNWVLNNEVNRWSKIFVEQRIFRNGLGIQGTLVPNDASGRNKLYAHPRNLRFTILVTQDLPAVHVIGMKTFVMSRSPIAAHLAVDRSLLFQIKTKCDVEVDFGDKFAVAHFKPYHDDPEPDGYDPDHDPKLIIPLNQGDRDFLKKCDDFVNGHTGHTDRDDSSDSGSDHNFQTPTRNPPSQAHNNPYPHPNGPPPPYEP